MAHQEQVCCVCFVEVEKTIVLKCGTCVNVLCTDCYQEYKNKCPVCLQPREQLQGVAGEELRDAFITAARKQGLVLYLTSGPDVTKDVMEKLTETLNGFDFKDAQDLAGLSVAITKATRRTLIFSVDYKGDPARFMIPQHGENIYLLIIIHHREIGHGMVAMWC